MNDPALDSRRLRVWPLSERKSLSSLQKILVDPRQLPAECPPRVASALDTCARNIRRARERQASVILLYGAHLVKNGCMDIVNELVKRGWVTHLATNGAGVIHDWEFAFLGRSEESVRENVASGTFGAWDETGRAINVALLAGGLRGEGFGRSLGRFIAEDGTRLPEAGELRRMLQEDHAHPLSPARAELLAVMTAGDLQPGPAAMPHPFREHSIVANAFQRGIPMTVHPGIGYDIYCNHPLFNGAAIGRAAAQDYRALAGSISQLDGGVALSVGSAIMAPQVFEKALSAANNVRLQAGQDVVRGHTIYVVDIQDGGNWDWSHGEPPKDNPAYYLRFCKTYARMGGEMNYVQSDNVVFLAGLLARLGNS